MGEQAIDDMRFDVAEKIGYSCGQVSYFHSFHVALEEWLVATPGWEFDYDDERKQLALRLLDWDAGECKLSIVEEVNGDYMEAFVRAAHKALCKAADAAEG